MIAISKIWRHRGKEREDIEREFIAELGISPLLARLLINRGVDDLQKAKLFMNPGLDQLHPPRMMKGIEEASERIKYGLANRERIVIYGDYDVDGLTSTALLMSALRNLGGSPRCYIPNRLSEGYGLTEDSLNKIREDGVDLLITVDCGITATKESHLAKKLGIDLIVIDHHRPKEELPQAVSLIDPKQEDCNYPFSELTGVALTFKLAQRLFEAYGKDSSLAYSYLDLVALGTIADIAPLISENRILIKEGLKALSNTQRPGLRALISSAGLEGRELSVGQVGYIIAPRINAAGRLSDPRSALKLLLSDSPEEAQRLALKLNYENAERQRLEKKILEEALALCEEIDFDKERVLVLAHPDWHFGVIGIVASRIVERLYRPTILISLENGRGRGSARSIPNFSIFKALVECSSYLIKFGGHTYAAGLEIESDKIADFREKINLIASQWLEEKDLIPSLNIDAKLSLEQVNLELAEELEQLAPYGNGNPKPIFASYDLVATDCQQMGRGGDHLRIRFREDNWVREGIGFRMGDKLEAFLSPAWPRIDIAYTLDAERREGGKRCSLKFTDLKIKEAELDNESFLEGLFQRARDILRISSYRRSELDIIYGRFKEAFSVDHKISRSSPLPIIDKRSIADKRGVLRELISSSSERTLIYLLRVEDAINLADILRWEFPEKRNSIAYYHLGLARSTQYRIKDMFSRGDIRIISLSTGCREMELEESSERVIFYSLAPELAWWQEEGRELSRRREIPIGLLFGEEDIHYNEKVWDIIAPELDTLRSLYKVLNSRQRTSIGLSSSDIDIITRQVSLSAYTVSVGLDIFRELKLIKQEREGYISLVPVSHKVDIFSSNIFSERQSIKTAGREWERRLLRTPEDEL